MGKFLIRETALGFAFYLQEPSGNLIAASAQTYKTYQSAAKGASSVQKNASHARIEDQTGDTDVKLNPKFEIFRLPDQKDEPFQFRLRAKNGQVIAVSQTSFSSVPACLETIEIVRKNTAGSKIDLQLVV